MYDFINKNICSIVTMYQKVIQQYYENNRIISEMDKATQDILHMIESDTHKNANQGYKIYDKLFEIRKARRKAKNDNELILELYHFCKDNENFKNQLQKIQGNALKIYKEQSERFYTPRTDIGIID